MIIIATLLMQPIIAVQVAPEPGLISNFDCKVVLREGATIDLTGDFHHAAGLVRFQSKDPRLPLGGKPIALRFNKSASTLDGSAAFEKKWLNFDIHPVVDRSTSVARIQFQLESAPPMEALVEVNSLYGVAICNVKHSETQS